MKKFCELCLSVVLVGVLALASAGQAQADGGRYRGSLKDVSEPVRYNWGGFYLGAHLGYAWADVNWSVVSESSNFWDNSGGGGTSFNQDPNSWIAGGHIGYNFQAGRWVYGVEASLTGSDLKDSRFAATITGDDLRTTKIGTLALVTGRIGYSWDQWLAYVKGGFATANVRTSVSDVAAPSVGSWSASERHNGWTIGTGLEYMLSPNVIVGLEYNYIDLGSARHASPTSDVATAVVDVDTTIQTVWARLSFKLSP